MKKFIVAALHGDEPFGLKVVGNMQSSNYHNTAFRVGHPEALAKRTRYVQQDLNRSFNVNDESLEANIANDITREIAEFSADIVLDIHSSVSNVKKIAIVAKRSEFIEYVADEIGMDAVVIMPKSLLDTSLIGCFPDKAISLEFGRHIRSDKVAKEIATKIQFLDFPKKPLTLKLPVFKVYSRIDKNFAGLAGIENLVYNEVLGGYPFLAGVDTYESFGGFLVKKIS